MQITCPKCTTSYRIADNAIGGSGRSVHCVRCDQVWRVEPPGAAATAQQVEAEETAFREELGKPAPALAPRAEPAAAPAPVAAVAEPPAEEAPPPEPAPEPEPPPVPEPAAETAPATEAAAEPMAPTALTDIPIPVTQAPPLVPAAGDAAATAPQIDNAPHDVEAVAARRARAAAKRRHGFRIPLPVAIAAMVVTCAALVGLRKDVVRYAPQMGSLYASMGLPVNLRGLEFKDVKIGSEIHDGVPVLVVEGTIVNEVAMAVDVPRLRFALRNASGAELYTWTAQPSQAVLQPGARLPFRSRLASPPAEGHDVQVRFFTRRDAIAGLR